MIRDFLRDVRGNYALATAIAMVPIMGGLALAIDFTEMNRQRQATINALDAACLATGRRIAEGATDEQVTSYAEDFFKANLGPVAPEDSTLSLTLPNTDIGGGKLKCRADLKYKPYFYHVFAELIGAASDIKKIDFNARSEIRLKNTLEVALVLDNSGSMDQTGEGSGEKRIDLLKQAAKQLVDTMAEQATQIKQVQKPVQFALVPFAASVNVGPDHDDAAWMDTEGLSPVHHENFDWSGMSAANNPDRYVEWSGTAWYKRGDGWGDTEDQPLTRFSLYADMKAETDREEVPNSREFICTRYRSNGTCRNGYWSEPDYAYVTSQYASWQGCVEARPFPYNNNDAPPNKATPETLFVPMFAPDEPGHLWRDLDHDDEDNELDSNNFGYSNSWWADWSNGWDAVTRQADGRKYYRIKPYGSPSPGWGDGPNASCTTNPITPLKDVSTAAGKQAIKNAIDAMSPNGNTNVPEGTAWGWRVVSGGAPFTEGRPDSELGNDKVVIVLTDGANTYGDLADGDSANNKSTYAAYGYTGKGYDGTTTTRLYMGTSDTFNKSRFTASNYTAALDEQMLSVCAHAKAAGIIVMTVSLDLSLAEPSEKKAIEALKECASESRYRKEGDKPAKLHWNTDGGDLDETFKKIADELSNLRIVG